MSQAAIPDHYVILRDRLAGTSNRALFEHLSLYQRDLRELANLAEVYPRATGVSGAEAGILSRMVQEVFQTPICDLTLSFEGNGLATAMNALRDEVRAKGLQFWPNWYFGDDDFWTTDRAISVNVPWFLGDDIVRLAVASRGTQYTDDDLLRILRHEYAHALLYAFEGWKHWHWVQAFGDFDKEYTEDWEPDASKDADFVAHLDRPGTGGLLHYAQKHPDEDWAETFATWISGEWQAQMETGSDLRKKKILTVQDLVSRGFFYGEPIVKNLGRRTPSTRNAMTVGEYVGTSEASFSMHAALLRREPALQVECALHELYFSGLGGFVPAGGGITMQAIRAAVPSLLFSQEATRAYGSYEAWSLDMRAITAACDGWALTVYDPRARRLRNVLVAPGGAGIPPGCPVILACDLHEHAFALDYGIVNRSRGIASWFTNIDWRVVEERLATARAVLPPGHQLGMIVPDGGSSCAKCSYVSGEVTFVTEKETYGGTACLMPEFAAWNGSPGLPAPADRYCCDLFQVRVVPPTELAEAVPSSPGDGAQRLPEAT